MDAWIPAVNVTATFAAVVAALVIAAVDRRAADRRAEQDRAAARREARMRHELDMLARLAELLNRGGSTDSSKSARMGSETAALLVALDGERRLPIAWATHVRGSLADAEARLRKQDTPDWRSGANEAILLLHRVAREYHHEEAKR